MSGGAPFVAGSGSLQADKKNSDAVNAAAVPLLMYVLKLNV
jgi:hypothetical protein